MAPKPSDLLQYRKNRLATFTEGAKIGNSRALKQWSVTEVDVDNLADCGFYFSPTKGFPNQITCYWCGKKEKDVEKNTSIALQHLRTNPKCPYSLIASNLKLFIMTADKDTFWTTVGASGSAPKSIIDPHSKESVALRRSTFKNHWKFDSKRGCKVTSKNLSLAGFYYSPVEPGSDRVICMYCDCPLEDWDRNDDPLQEHRNNAFTYCYFLDTIGKDLAHDTSIAPMDETAAEGHSNGQSDSANSTHLEIAPQDEAASGIDRGNDDRIQQSELSNLLGHTSSPVAEKINESSLKASPQDSSSHDSIMDLLLSDSLIASREKSLSPESKRHESLEPNDGFDAFDFSIDDLKNQDKGTIFNNREIMPQKKYSRKSKRKATGFSLLPKKEASKAEKSDNLATENDLSLPIGPISPEVEPLDFQELYREDYSSLPGKVNTSPSAKFTGGPLKIRDSFILNSELDDPDTRDEDESEGELEIKVEGGEVVDEENDDVKIDDEKDEEDESLSIRANSDSEYTLGTEDSDMKASVADESLKSDTNSSIVSESTHASADESLIPNSLIDTKKRKDKNDQKKAGQKRQKLLLDERKEENSKKTLPKLQKSLFSDDMDIDQDQLDKILNSPKKGRKMKALNTTEQMSAAPAIFDLSNQNIGDYEESNLSFIEGDIRLPSKRETLKMLDAFKTVLHQEGKITLRSKEESQRQADMNSSPSKEVLTKANSSEINTDGEKIEQVSKEIIVHGSDLRTEEPKELPENNDALAIKDTEEGIKYATTTRQESEVDNVATDDHDANLIKNLADILMLDANEGNPDDRIKEKLHGSSAEAHVHGASEPLGPGVSKTDVTNGSTVTNAENGSQNGFQNTTVTSAESNQTLFKGPNEESRKEDHAISKKRTEVEPIVEETENKDISEEREAGNTAEKHGTTEIQINATQANHIQNDDSKSMETSETGEIPVALAALDKSSAKYEESKSMIQNSTVAISEKGLKDFLKEELRNELKVQLKEELRAEIQRELLREELRAEIQKELLEERAREEKIDTYQEGPQNNSGNYASVDKAPANAFRPQNEPEENKQEVSKDHHTSEVDVSVIQNMTLSPSSYREYVQDLEKMDEDFSEKSSDLPKKMDVVHEGRSEVDVSRIEDSASEQPELLQLSDKEKEEITVEKQASEEIGSPNDSITSPLAQGSTFSDHDSVSKIQGDDTNLPEAERRAFNYAGLESSPQNGTTARNPSASSEQWKDRRLSFGTHFGPNPSSDRKLSFHSDDSTDKIKNPPDNIPTGLSRLSVDRVVSEMQALLDTIDYLSEVSATRRELHDDAEGLITLFVAAMPEEEEFLGVKEWMLHNASTCGRTVREISGKLISAYEDEFEQLIQQVESMDTID